MLIAIDVIVISKTLQSQNSKSVIETRGEKALYKWMILDFNDNSKAKKKCLFPITWQKKFESVGRIEILFYFEILFLLGPSLAESISEKVKLTFQMRARSTTELSLHKNQSRKQSISDKRCRFTFLSKIGRFDKVKYARKRLYGVAMIRR